MKQDLRSLYKELTNNMVSYNAQGKIPDALTADSILLGMDLTREIDEMRETT